MCPEPRSQACDSAERRAHRGHNAILPLETVNLRSVILTATHRSRPRPQFLQVNPMDGNEEIYRVGRDVASAGRPERQRGDPRPVDLVGVDLSKLMSIRLGSTVSRPSLSEATSTTPVRTKSRPGPLPAIGDTGTPQEASYWDNWQGNYWETYERRHDPCSPGYYLSYYDHNIVQTLMVQLTDIGLMAKRGKDKKLWVSVTDLTDTSVRASGSRCWTHSSTSWTSGTDPNGWAILDTPRTRCSRATDGPYMNWLKLDNGSALSTSHLTPVASSWPRGLRFFYTERGVASGRARFTCVSPPRPDGRPARRPPHSLSCVTREVSGYPTHRHDSVDGFYSLHFTTRTRPRAPIWQQFMSEGSPSTTHSVSRWCDPTD